MDPEEKKDTYKEGLLVANWAENFKKQSLAAISAQGPLTPATLHREASTGLPASVLNCLPSLRSCHLSQPFLKVSRNLFQPIGLRLFPIQLEIHSSSQSEQLYSNQSRPRLFEQSKFEALELSFAWQYTYQGPGVRSPVCISQLLSDSTEDRASLAKLKHSRCLAREEQTSAGDAL